MKTNLKLLMETRTRVIAGLLVLASGCGSAFTGTYTGTKNYSGQVSQMTMTLSDANGQLTGSWSDQTGSGSLQGTSNGNTAMVYLFNGAAGGTLVGNTISAAMSGTITASGGNQITGTLQQGGMNFGNTIPTLPGSQWPQVPSVGTNLGVGAISITLRK
ncbi:hypothetical protein K2X30_14175 [bacterium]|nr:hypothetical protein [bacterium]